MTIDINSKKPALSEDSAMATLTVTDNTTVVSHDTQDALPELKSDMTYGEAFEYINTLYKLRLQWERDQYHTSCTRLYELLRECYRLATHRDIDDNESKLRRCIEDQCKRKMLKILKNTTIEAKIVRSVFESLNNRRRVSTYAIVIQVAKLENVNVDHFVDWLTLKGGVEEVRLSQAAAKKNTRKQVNATKKIKFSDEDIQRGKENFDAFLRRMNDADASASNDHADQQILKSEDNETASGDPEHAQLSKREHLDICTAENCYCDAAALNDEAFVCEPTKNEDKDETLPPLPSHSDDAAACSDELLVCIARRRNTDDLAEIVYAVTDKTVAQLVFAVYAESRYGASDELAKLTRDIKAKLAA